MKKISEKDDPKINEKPPKNHPNIDPEKHEFGEQKRNTQNTKSLPKTLARATNLSRIDIDPEGKQIIAKIN